MVSMDVFASAFGFDAKSDDVWTALGKVTAISGNTFSVMLGGSATPMECEAYCHAVVGDIVFVVISKGNARAIANKGGEAATRDFTNALINTLGNGTSDVTLDDTLLITQNTNATEEKYYLRPISKIWPYFKGKADAVYAPLTHYHGYLYNGADASTSLHRMYVSTNDNLVIQNRADASSSWGNEKYAAITTSAPSNSSQQAANKVLATPNGSNGYPSMRALVADDIPNLAAGKVTSGTFDIARVPVITAAKGGTG